MELVLLVIQTFLGRVAKFERHKSRRFEHKSFEGKFDSYTYIHSGYLVNKDQSRTQKIPLLIISVTSILSKIYSEKLWVWEKT